MTERTSIIVSSKNFRRFLKKVFQKYEGFPVDDVVFDVRDGVLTVSDLEFPIAHRGISKNLVSKSSIEKVIKVLKQASDQPIKVTFEPMWACMELQCQF